MQRVVNVQKHHMVELMRSQLEENMLAVKMFPKAQRDGSAAKRTLTVLPVEPSSVLTTLTKGLITSSNSNSGRV